MSEFARIQKDSNQPDQQAEGEDFQHGIQRRRVRTRIHAPLGHEPIVPARPGLSREKIIQAELDRRRENLPPARHIPGVSWAQMKAAVGKIARPMPAVQREAEDETLEREENEEETNEALQMKGLAVSSPDDPAEEEADAVADSVMRMEDEDVQRMATAEEDDSLRESPMMAAREMAEDEEIAETPIAREAADEEEISTKSEGCPHNVYRKCSECEAEGVQRKATIQREGDGNLRASGDVSERIQSRRGGGSAMSEGDRAFFEPRFGADFSGVRVHDDSEAQQLAGDVNAKAFTIGSDVFFGAGQYGQGDDSKKLFAHELTHVVQQGGARIGRKIERKPGDLIRRQEVVQREEEDREGESYARPFVVDSTV